MTPVHPERRGDIIPVVVGAPYDAATLSWQITPPKNALVVIVKGTFDIVPGEGLRARERPSVFCGEMHFGDDPKGSSIYPSDYAIFKPRADVILLGHAHAPGGKATAMRVGLRFGQL